MPAYKPSRLPDAYPATFHRAFEAVIGGEAGKGYQTYLGDVACGRRTHIRQKVSSFKASVAKFPLHPLHNVIPRTRTRLSFTPNGNGTDAVWLTVTHYTRPADMLGAIGVGVE